MEFYIKLGQKYFKRFSGKYIVFFNNALQTTVFNYFFVNDFRLKEATNTIAKSYKFIRQFSQLKGYFNPALTGYVGNMVMNFVSNKGAGIGGGTKRSILSAVANFEFYELSEKINPVQLERNFVLVNILKDFNSLSMINTLD